MIYFGCVKCGTPMCSPDEKAGQKETCPECSNVNMIPLQAEPDPIQKVVVIPHGCPKCGTQMYSKSMNVTPAAIGMIGFLIFVGSILSMCTSPDLNTAWLFGLLFMFMGAIAGRFWDKKYKCPQCETVVWY